MKLEDQFTQAVQRVERLSRRPSNEELLRLYALYKQATEGDVTGERPGGFDFKGIAKYDAWLALKGKSREEAMQEYIVLVDNLTAIYQ
jgi:acyl-CoA-binding protein